jgi:hypothetical protein
MSFDSNPADDREPDIYFVKYPVDTTLLGMFGRPVEFHVLAAAALHLCEKAGCHPKTFEYHGVIDAGPLPGQLEGKRTHLWSAVRA